MWGNILFFDTLPRQAHRRFVSVENWPQLSSAQKKRFYHWVWRVDDAKGGLIGAYNFIGRLEKGAPLSFVELDRFMTALRWASEHHITMGPISPEDDALCTQLKDILSGPHTEAERVYRERAVADKLSAEQDQLGTQIAIAKLSAIASVASAIAAVAAVVIAFKTLR